MTNPTTARLAAAHRTPAGSRWRVVASLLALSLGVAACGSTETSSVPTLATQVPSAVDDTPAEDASADDADADDITTTTESIADNSADEPEDAAPVENLFPDIDVLNIADGATVNLATALAGADKATLLWFFAPH